MDETWLYHYGPETKQQSMEWRHRGSPRPQKIPSAKIRWKSSRLDFFGIKTASSHWLSFKGPDHQRGELLISVGATEGHFEEKRREKFLFLHDNATAHQALATQKKLAYLGFSILITHPILRIWSRRTTTCSLDWKNN